jgi:predicted hydrocarbon binding protein
MEFDPRLNIATLGGESMVFHCHHYNCALQRAIEEGLGDDAADLLQRAGQEVAREQGLALKSGTGNDGLADAAKRFASLGFGRWDLGKLTRGRGTATLYASHYGLGWISKYGERKTPACHFAAGFLAGSIAASFSLAPERVRVRETRCCATGADECVFDAEVL